MIFKRVKNIEQKLSKYVPYENRLMEFEDRYFYLYDSFHFIEATWSSTRSIIIKNGIKRTCDIYDKR